MVLDTSAIVAILSNEPERVRFIRLIEAAPIRRLSAANRVEATLVIEGRKRDAGRADLDLFLSEAEVKIVPVSLDQMELACQAFCRYGKGRHPAGLNFAREARGQAVRERRGFADSARAWAFAQGPRPVRSVARSEPR